MEMQMTEAEYKAFWITYGIRYAIGAACVVLLASVLHAATAAALNRLWPPRCSKCEENKQ